MNGRGSSSSSGNRGFPPLPTQHSGSAGGGIQGKGLRPMPPRPTPTPRPSIRAPSVSRLKKAATPQRLPWLVAPDNDDVDDDDAYDGVNDEPTVVARPGSLSMSVSSISASMPASDPAPSTDRDPHPPSFSQRTASQSAWRNDWSAGAAAVREANRIVAVDHDHHHHRAPSIPCEIDDGTAPISMEGAPSSMSMRAMTSSVPLYAPPSVMLATPPRPFYSPIDTVPPFDAAVNTRARRAPSSSLAWRYGRLLLAMMLIGFAASAVFLFATKRGRAPAHAMDLAKRGWDAVTKIGHR